MNFNAVDVGHNILRINRAPHKDGLGQEPMRDRLRLLVDSCIHLMDHIITCAIGLAHTVHLHHTVCRSRYRWIFQNNRTFKSECMI